MIGRGRGRFGFRRDPCLERADSEERLGELLQKTELMQCFEHIPGGGFSGIVVVLRVSARRVPFSRDTGHPGLEQAIIALLTDQHRNALEDDGCGNGISGKGQVGEHIGAAAKESAARVLQRAMVERTECRQS